MRESYKLRNEDWLEHATILDIQKTMNNGELSSLQLVSRYLENITKNNHSGARLNAIIEVNPEALQIAESLDAERKLRGMRGPLHGIPIVLKDNIETADLMHTSAGSLALKNNYAKEDATTTRKLRKAGAVILGKANMTEWANFMSMSMKNGYSSRGGQVLNPYGAHFDVGGSSSGSAVAVAAHFSTLSIGTETSGSILSPASQNNVVGIKPTVGLISRAGIIPLSHSQDTAGPIARSVTDAAILLGALTGQDEKDFTTQRSIERSYRDYTSNLNANALYGARIGVARSLYIDILPEDKRLVMEKAIEDIKEAGATIVELESISPMESDSTWDYNVLLYEFKSDLNAYLGKLPSTSPVHSLADVIRFNEDHPEQTLKYGQDILIESDKTSGTMTEPAYLESRLRDLQLSRTRGIDVIMAEHQLDALLFPNSNGAGVAAKAGYPSIAVPGGFTGEGQPVGIVFSGLAYSESSLVGLAYAYEQATKHRKLPVLN
ncbi:amidase family protein [Pseudalkalibacillus salsuginis]|uniref:amidase family protein n=1 Tax=Pseudalkalibacillus salsuginis TaxID=2910972 RepID=UPI001EEEDF83|nr:amidase family protein [Pseudalkalibacillus salsuginis]MCF6410842.1 amidase [Pseudalkalibacillus salsuginis]